MHAGAHSLHGRAASVPQPAVGLPAALPRRAAVPVVARQHGELPQRRESTYEPCEPSTSSLADIGTRMTLERLYSWPALDALSGPPHGAFLVTLDDRPQRTRNQDRAEDYFANVGDAIRSLREDIPMLFERELNYAVYREDVVFRDPRNCFKGMKNYQLIFWSLRFHGKIFFQRLYVDVKRIWQPEDGLIKMRWTVHGIPRVPWEAEGTFDGISTYKLDSHGRIYEHSVDNVLLRDPPMATNPPLLAGINLQPLVPSGAGQPVPGAWCQGADAEDAWGAAVQRMVASALQHLDPSGSMDEEPTPALAACGPAVAASGPGSLLCSPCAPRPHEQQHAQQQQQRHGGHAQGLRHGSGQARSSGAEAGAALSAGGWASSSPLAAWRAAEGRAAASARGGGAAALAGRL